jgi:hypothetical protein
MPTPPYNYVNLGTARQQLANRLYDSAQVFWSPAELNLYIAEALRTWNSLTSYWKSDFTFQGQQGLQWLDMTDFTVMPNSTRLPQLKDTDLYLQMQYHLLEPPVGVNPWPGVSTQFSADDLVSAVSRRRDETLSVTGCTYTRRLTPAVAGRIVLPDTVIDVRRLAYLQFTPRPYGSGNYGSGPYGVGTAQIGQIVWQEDTWAEEAFNRSYIVQPPGTPQTFLMSTEPPLAFEAYPPPMPGHYYELLTIEGGPAMAANMPQPLNIPDDWSYVIKWGALADLLSRESNAKDPTRAQYCEQRYRMGLQILTTAPALLSMRLTNLGQSLQVDSVREADLFNTGWEAAPQGPPQEILAAGLNLIAVSPAPDAGLYSFTATVVCNAPVPVLDTDPVQLARDDYDAVIDYAQHLATFKMGGAEFMSTMPLFQRFLKQASLYGLKLTEMGEFTTYLLGISAGEEQVNPRLSVPQTEGQ